MRKRKQFHNIIENVIYFKIPNYHCSPPLKLQLLSSTSPNNDNCSPSLSTPPLPNYNCSPSPPCLGTSFVSKHCMHDFTVWANHIHRLNSLVRLRWSLLHPLVVLGFWAFFHLKFVNYLFWNLRSLEIYISAKCCG